MLWFYFLCVQKIVVGCDIHSYFQGYFNISTLGIVAMDNDVEMMNILFDIGCDPNYNGTAVNFMDAMEYFDYDSAEHPCPCDQNLES